MNKRTLEYIKSRANETETSSVRGVSCSDLRELLDEREELLSSLREIANDWPLDTPDIPAKHARKIARAAIDKATK